MEISLHPLQTLTSPSLKPKLYKGEFYITPIRSPIRLPIILQFPYLLKIDSAFLFGAGIEMDSTSMGR